ncbi:hypothetical protein ACIGJO_26495 [Streptomyces sp. NPDC079020]|uniref:hypothetical protein n=1 Tax=Streptomyces sp. NPDC079020 TaxID=3365722 RepID=UPI0037CFA128
MSKNAVEPTEAEAESTNDAGLQQIPITIPARELPAADARDRILAAIATEAEHVNALHPGEGAAALGELARAYALITGAGDPRPAVAVSPPGAPALLARNGVPTVPGGATGTLPFVLTDN